MKFSYLIVSMGIFVSCTTGRNFSSAKEELTGDILIENVNIIDVENNRVIKNQYVLITGKKNSNISFHGKKKMNATTIIHGEGKYLMPGLWDMHVHPLQENWYPEIMKRRNVYAVASGRLVEQWKAALPDRIIPSLLYRSDKNDPSPDSVRKLVQSGKYRVFGEIMAQYKGVAPNDPSLEPYWSVLEELNIPVGIHIGPAPMGAPYMPGWEKVRARLHNRRGSCVQNNIT